MGIAAAAVGAAALQSGGQIFGAMQQANSANRATDMQWNMFQTLQQALGPYEHGGEQAMNMLMGKLSDLTQPFDMSMKGLEKTPGYQFIKEQGTKALANSNSTTGWGNSGPGAKSLDQFTTGLASATYQQQFDNYWKNNQNAFNMLMGPAQLGEAAAAGVGSGALQTGANIGSNMIGAGNAWAGAGIGAANSFSQVPMNFMLMNQLLGSSGGSSAGMGAMMGSMGAW